MLKRVLLFLSLFLISASATSDNQHREKVDSLIYYYQQCLANVNDPIIIKMADTLYERAGLYNDKRMQAIALCTKLDYYYTSSHENKRDSLIAYVKKVQSFAKETKLMEYYYFAWSSRLINYYLSLGEYNIALIEANNMLEEAEKNNDIDGIANCYYCLSNIYSAKQLKNKTLEYALKEIELYENNDFDRYNISMRYSTVGKIMIERGELEKGVEYLEKAEKSARSPYHNLQVKLGYVPYHIEQDEIDAAGNILKECRAMVDTVKVLERYRIYLYQPEIIYYRATGKNDDALRAVTEWEKSLKERNENASAGAIYRTKAEILQEMGKSKEAALYYRLSLDGQEKEKEKNEIITTAEFATILGIQKLENEKKELIKNSHQNKLLYIKIISGLLALLLLLAIITLYKQKKLNNQLKESRDILDSKNQKLLKTEEELLKAKDAAEESSRMKSVFIKNISHEIRTPLNSIVGFSAILSEVFSEGNDEMKLCSASISESSQLLLKIINDILDISDLDEKDKQVVLTPTYINDCCLRAIEETRPLLIPGVNLEYNPSPDVSVINSNDALLMFILRNLLNNAAKFTFLGTITLSFDLSPDKSYVVFTVTDTGIGIPEEKYEYIFERFTKINDFSQGTGLGLPIAQLSVEKLGGYIYIDKNYTQGARFIFVIPYIQAKTL